MRNIGLDKEEITSIILQRIDANPDLKYYIEDEFFLSYINALISGVAFAIEENNDRILRFLNE